MCKPKLWDNEKHEEALRRRREKDYCHRKEKYMQDIPDEETTETPVEQNPVTNLPNKGIFY